MQTTVRQETILAEYTTSVAGVVLLAWSGDSFRTEQQFDDGNVATIELAGPLDAFLCYEYAREHGCVRGPFPVPVANPEPDPPDESAPALPLAAEARRIRRASGISQRQLARIAGFSVGVVQTWECGTYADRLWYPSRYLAQLARYAVALRSVERGEHAPDKAMGRPPLRTPDDSVASGPSAEGVKRRCSRPGCGAILSRFNDGDRCAPHA